MNGEARLVIMAIGIALMLSCCGKEEAKKVEVPANLSAQEETAKQVAGLSARVDELVKKNEELDKEVAKLDKQTAEIDRLYAEIEKQAAELERRERALAKARTEAADKKAAVPKKVQKKEKKKKKRKLAVVEPVPTKTKDGGEQPGKKDGAGGGALGVEGGGPALATPGDLALINIKFATSVDRQNRNPVDPTDSFKIADDKVYCWTVFSYSGAEDTAANIVWIRDGKEISTIQLRVGHSSHWRTWSYIRLTDKSVGEWEAQIQDLSGNVLGAGKFAVTE